MNSVIGSKHPTWDLNRSKYVEIDSLPLMSTIGPVLIILALYLVFVLKIGPAFMRKREACKLNVTMLVYNGVQVAISVYLVGRFFLNLLEMGLIPKMCYMDDNSSRSKILFGTYLYFSAKVTELLDTVFFVLRKKENQISFLHLYHHSIMVIGTWAMLKYWPSHTLLFIGFLNSLVHVFMYTYYGLAALGPNVAKYLKWKKYMTKFQLIQFASIIVQYVATVRVSDCPPAQGVAIFVSCNTGFIMLLFLNFYRKSYIKRKDRMSKTDVTAIQKIDKHEVEENESSKSITNGVSLTNGALISKEMSDINEDLCETLSNSKDFVTLNSTDISNFIKEMSTPTRKYSLKND